MSTVLQMRGETSFWRIKKGIQLQASVPVFVPGLGLSLLQAGETSPGVTALSHFISSLWDLLSSSLSVALSSVADSLPECSADVTFSSMSSGTGRTTGPSVSREEEEEEEDEGGSWVSGRIVAEGGASSFSLPPSPDASFCFWSCSFWRLRCFLRNLALRFLNQTWWQRGGEGELDGEQAEKIHSSGWKLVVETLTYTKGSIQWTSNDWVAYEKHNKCSNNKRVRKAVTDLTYSLTANYHKQA